MNSFNVSVKAKLFATLALAGVVMVAVGVLGLSGTKSSNGHLDALFANRFAAAAERAWWPRAARRFPACPSTSQPRC
jgi:hypothetical protein